jgi:hypothetical protein
MLASAISTSELWRLFEASLHSFSNSQLRIVSIDPLQGLVNLQPQAEGEKDGPAGAQGSSVLSYSQVHSLVRWLCCHETFVSS